MHCSVVQAVTPDYLRGRVIANLATIGVLAMGGGGALLQVLIERTGAAPVFLAAGLAILLSGVGLLYFREIREIRLAAP